MILGKNLSKLGNCIKTLSEKFNKGVFIVETAYPWTLGWNDNLSNLYGMKNQLIENILKAKHKTAYTKVIEIPMLSSLSIIPPCPGIILPKSLILN